MNGPEAPPPFWDPNHPAKSVERLAEWVCCVPAADPVVALERAQAAVKECSFWADPEAGSCLSTSGHRWSRPTIVLTGDVKAGRSTLLNGILGRSLLRTAHRATTPVPVSVFAHGVRWIEVPPGQSRHAADGRVLVVDVRQPLPRRGALAGGASAPAVMVLTKLDRAHEDAVLADDPSAEVDAAVALAVRRATHRCEGALRGWVTCDARDRREVQERVLPVLQAVVGPATEQARRRAAARAIQQAEKLAERLSSPRPMRWPPEVPLRARARQVVQAGVTAAMSSFTHDQAAWQTALPHDAHHALDARLAQVEVALAAMVTRAWQAAQTACGDAVARLTDALATELAAAWCAHAGENSAVEIVFDGVLLPEAPPLPIAPLAESVVQGGRGLLPGLARLRSVASRHAEVAQAWDQACTTLQVDLGAALLDTVGTTEETLKRAVDAAVQRTEHAHPEALQAAAVARTAERMAAWRLRDWLRSGCFAAGGGESGQRDGEARSRVL